LAAKVGGGHGTRLLKAFVAMVHTGRRLISAKSKTVFPPLCSTVIQRQSGSDLWGQRASCPLIVSAPEHCGEAPQGRARTGVARESACAARRNAGRWERSRLRNDVTDSVLSPVSWVGFRVSRIQTLIPARVAHASRVLVLASR